MRSILIGTVESTAVALRELHSAGHAPALLVTLPREKSSRHSDFLDLSGLARELGVPVACEADVNAPNLAQKIRELGPDYIFVIGWSQILKPALFGLARKGVIGYHPAPLPKLRGRAVIPWTILLGLSETGSTLFAIDEGVDSGPILAQELFPVSETETAATLMEKHMDSLRRLLKNLIPRLASGNPVGQAQDHAKATYCAKRVAEDGAIDWNRSALDVWRLVRAVSRPYPGAFTDRGGDRLFVWKAEPVLDAPYFGLPGQIQQISETALLVTCGDGRHLRLTEWTFAEGTTPSAFKMHEKFRTRKGD